MRKSGTKGVCTPKKLKSKELTPGKRLKATESEDLKTITSMTSILRLEDIISIYRIIKSNPRGESYDIKFWQVVLLSSEGKLLTHFSSKELLRHWEHILSRCRGNVEMFKNYLHIYETTTEAEVDEVNVRGKGHKMLSKLKDLFINWDEEEFNKVHENSVREAFGMRDVSANQKLGGRLGGEEVNSKYTPKSKDYLNTITPSKSKSSRKSTRKITPSGENYKEILDAIAHPPESTKICSQQTLNSIFKCKRAHDTFGPPPKCARFKGLDVNSLFTMSKIPNSSLHLTTKIAKLEQESFSDILDRNADYLQENSFLHHLQQVREGSLPPALLSYRLGEERAFRHARETGFLEYKMRIMNIREKYRGYRMRDKDLDGNPLQTTHQISDEEFGDMVVSVSADFGELEKLLRGDKFVVLWDDEDDDVLRKYNSNGQPYKDLVKTKGTRQIAKRKAFLDKVEIKGQHHHLYDDSPD